MQRPVPMSVALVALRLGMLEAQAAEGWREKLKAAKPGAWVRLSRAVLGSELYAAHAEAKKLIVLFKSTGRVECE